MAKAIRVRIGIAADRAQQATVGMQKLTQHCARRLRLDTTLARYLDEFDFGCH